MFTQEEFDKIQERLYRGQIKNAIKKKHLTFKINETKLTKIQVYTQYTIKRKFSDNKTRGMMYQGVGGMNSFTEYKFLVINNDTKEKIIKTVDELTFYDNEEGDIISFEGDFKNEEKEITINIDIDRDLTEDEIKDLQKIIDERKAFWYPIIVFITIVLVSVIVGIIVR